MKIVRIGIWFQVFCAIIVTFVTLPSSRHPPMWLLELSKYLVIPVLLSFTIIPIAIIYSISLIDVSRRQKAYAILATILLALMTFAAIQ